MYAIQGIDTEAEVEIVITWMIRLEHLHIILLFCRILDGSFVSNNYCFINTLK